MHARAPLPRRRQPAARTHLEERARPAQVQRPPAAAAAQRRSWQTRGARRAARTRVTNRARARPTPRRRLWRGSPARRRQRHAPPWVWRRAQGAARAAWAQPQPQRAGVLSGCCPTSVREARMCSKGGPFQRARARRTRPPRRWATAGGGAAARAPREGGCVLRSPGRPTRLRTHAAGGTTETPSHAFPRHLRC
jgi:hypothetical protein